MWKRDQSENTVSTTSRDASQSTQAGQGTPSQKLVMDLGKSVMIKGELSGSEDLILYGRMEGGVKLPGHTLTIGPHAEIKAEVFAGVVVIQGAVIGNVTADNKVEIQATGSVIGDIVSPRLAIVDGGCLRGRVQMESPNAASGTERREPRRG